MRSIDNCFTVVSLFIIYLFYPAKLISKQTTVITGTLSTSLFTETVSCILLSPRIVKRDLYEN